MFVGIPVPIVGSLLAALLFGGLEALRRAVVGETLRGQSAEASLRIGHAAFLGPNGRNARQSPDRRDHVRRGDRGDGCGVSRKRKSFRLARVGDPSPDESTFSGRKRKFDGNDEGPCGFDVVPIRTNRVFF